MQQIIEIPGVGEVEFPDTMSDEEISVAAKRLHDEANAGSGMGEKLGDLRSGMANAVIGAGKGALKSAIGLGEMVAPALRMIPGVRDYVATPEQFGQAREMLAPQSTGESIGQAVGQGAEYMIPAGAMRSAVGKIAPRIAGKLLPNMAADAASGAAVAATHGDDVSTAAGLSAAVPVAGKVAQGTGNLIKAGGVRLARAGIKPTVTEMKQTAGASRDGINNVANRIAEFIVDNRLTSPDKAQALVNSAEAEIQSLVGSQGTDAATRAARYLKALENSAAQQGLGASDVAILRNAAKELVEGPMGENIYSFIPGTSNLTSTRQLRATVPADEALRSARSASRWSNRKVWGEQKGASTEASKAVERAQRDAVKAAVPASRPAFAKASQGIKAREVLARKEMREGNRDVLGLTTQGIGAAELMRGKVPIMATIANMLRGGQLQLGVHAGRMADAIKNNDVQTAMEILSRMGVSLGADAAGEP